jgi:hypothetical protein
MLVAKRDDRRFPPALEQRAACFTTEVEDFPSHADVTCNVVDWLRKG